MKQGPAVQFYYEDGDMKLSKLGHVNKNEWEVNCSDLTNVRVKATICYDITNIFTVKSDF